MKTDGIVTLRAMEPSDIDPMYMWENDTSLWSIGDNTTPFSRDTLLRFIDTATEDIYSTKQLRLIIEAEGEAIGTIDLFDFNPLNLRAGLGVLVYNKRHRGKGYATRAVRLMCEYAFTRLKLKQLYVHIPKSNAASIKMCANAGFTPSGILREWLNDEDVIVMQLIKSEMK